MNNLAKLQKIIIFSFAILVIFLIYVSLRQSFTPHTPQSNVPLIPQTNNSSYNPNIITSATPTPTPTISQDALSFPGVLNQPIIINNHATSSKIVTAIHIYNDPSQKNTIRIEVFGIDYEYSDQDKNSPNVKAFLESYNFALAELKKRGLKPENYTISTSNKLYIREITNSWLNLK